jgi:hypothetical protein
MRRVGIVDGMLFACWLALGLTIELLGYHLGLYRFVHWTLAAFVAVVLFGIVAPLLQKMLGQRPLVFAVVIFASAAGLEFANAAWLHWWTFHDEIRTSFSNELLLALGTSSPLFFIAWMIAFGFAPALSSKNLTLSDLGLRLEWHGNSPFSARVLVYCVICIVLLVALGRFGNAEYILQPFGIGYLAPTAPLEPRSGPALIDAGRAGLIFGLQAALIFAAVLCAIRMCGLTVASLGLGLGRFSVRQGLPLLIFLCVAPLPSFVLAGFDTAMSTNYPFVQSFSSVIAFIGYQYGYLLFFLTVEILFRSLLFLGLVSVLSPSGEPDGASASALMLAGMLSCLSYIIWHLGKPLPELFGAIVWGPIACAIIWQTRSIVYLVIPHWLWNVVLDAFVTLIRHGPFAS